ncbi:hypothetical protein HT031_004616 [Scenedesmus sp. PABB004]|nr:hypothetical protein HT031_004616 [Scenedesmus sp. PABB004]
MATAASRALPGALALLLLLLLAASGAHAAPGRRGSPSGRLTRACLAKLRGLFGSKACEDETSFKACTDDPAVVYEWHLVCHSGVVKDPAKTFAAPKGSTGLVNWRAVVPGTRAYLDLWNVGPTKGAIAQGILKTITDTYSHTALVLLNLALVDHTRGPEAPGSPPELEAGKIKAAAGHLARLVGFSKAAVDPGVPWVRLTSASPSPGGGGDLSNSVLYVPLTGRSDILASQPIWKSVLVSNTEPYFSLLTSDQQGLKLVVDAGGVSFSAAIKMEATPLPYNLSVSRAGPGRSAAAAAAPPAGAPRASAAHAAPPLRAAQLVFDAGSAALAASAHAAASFNGEASRSLEMAADFKGTDELISSASPVYLAYHKSYQVAPSVGALLASANSIPFTPDALKAIQEVVDNTSRTWADFAKEYGNYVLVGYRRRTTFSAVTSVSFTSKQVEASMQLDLATRFKGQPDPKASVGLLATYASKDTGVQASTALAPEGKGFLPTGKEGELCSVVPAPTADQLRSGTVLWVDSLVQQLGDCVSKAGRPKTDTGLTSWLDALLGAGGAAVEAILAPITLFPAFTAATNGALKPSDVPSNVISQLSLNADTTTLGAARQARGPPSRASGGGVIALKDSPSLCLQSMELTSGDPAFRLSPSNTLMMPGGDNTCLGYDAKPNVLPQDGTVAQVQSCDGSVWQKWLLDDVGRLRSYNAFDSSLCLTAPTPEVDALSTLELRACASGFVHPAQQWKMEIDTGALRLGGSGPCLTARDSGKALELADCAAGVTNNQRWFKDALSRLRPYNDPSLCMTIGVTGSKLYVGTCYQNAYFTQQFAAAHVDEVWPRYNLSGAPLRLNNSGDFSLGEMCLDVSGALMEEGGRVQAWYWSNTANQVWIPTVGETGSATWQANHSSLCLDVRDTITVDKVFGSWVFSYAGDLVQRACDPSSSTQGWFLDQAGVLRSAWRPDLGAVMFVGDEGTTSVVVALSSKEGYWDVYHKMFDYEDTYTYTFARWRHSYQ